MILFIFLIDFSRTPVRNKHYDISDDHAYSADRARSGKQFANAQAVDAGDRETQWFCAELIVYRHVFLTLTRSDFLWSPLGGEKENYIKLHTRASRHSLHLLLLVQCCRVLREMAITTMDPQSSQPRSVAVVGTGMAGLVTAHLLHQDPQKRYRVTLLEKVGNFRYLHSFFYR